MATPNGKSLAHLFFSESGRKGDRCKCEEFGAFITQRMSGYTNLCHHIKSKHEPTISQRVADSRVRAGAIMRTLCFSSKTLSAHAWLECVILCLHPFSFVENNVMRRHSRHNSISADSLRRYMYALTYHVELNSQELLPDKFAIVFDGWTGGDTHYVAVLATFASNQPAGYDSELLALAPMGEEDSFNAWEHYNYVQFVQEVFKKSWYNVVVVIGDNCNTNKAFARRVGPFFVGCYSHHYNLSMRDVIKFYSTTVDRVRELMRKLSYQILAARLCRHTAFRANLDNETRWSTTFEMLKRYLDILDILPKLEMPEIDDLLLDISGHKQVHAVCTQLHDIYSIKKNLQGPCTYVSNACVLLDRFIDRLGAFPTMRYLLGLNAAIVENPRFASALVKLQDGFEHNLTAAEKNSVQHLLNPRSAAHPARQSQGRNFPHHLLKRHQRTNDVAGSRYMNTKFIVPTSNICEHLFSVGVYAMNNRRKSLSPSAFE